MNVEVVKDTACLVTLPVELVDPDETSYLQECSPDKIGNIPVILLDFINVTRMNGLGATMLVKLQALARRQGRRLYAFGTDKHRRNVFKATGLNRAIPVFEKKKAAQMAAGLDPKNFTGHGNTPVPPTDTHYWARPVSALDIPPMPAEAINLNMQGRRVVGPVDGFGPLWQKRYRLHIAGTGTTPQEVITTLKDRFPSFQPPYNRFYPSHNGIRPGEVVLIDSKTPGGTVSTGVMVLYADETSFTFITPQGHPESGWVTFSAWVEGGNTIVQVLGLARANDPVYEAAFRFAGSAMQVRIWSYLLTALAGYLGVPADVSVEPVCIDKTLQWSQAGNIWYNAQIRTLLHSPVRLFSRKS